MILSWRQWCNQGGSGDICPRAQHFEGVIWDWNVTQQLWNVKCQRMLVIKIYKTSNASRWYPIAKSHQDRQVSQTEHLQTLVMFSGGACVFSNQLPHVLWLMVASQCFQIARLANFPISFSFYSCVTIDGNPAFTVHATAHAFSAAINFNSMLLRQHIWCLGNFLIFEGLTNFMLKWIWCDSEGNYDDYYLWDV